MAKTLTTWIDPLDAPNSLQAAVDIVKAQAQSISTATRQYSPNLLLTTHYGPWPQSACRQNLPADLLVTTPDDVDHIRQQIEAQGVGFGAWGVPLDQSSAVMAAQHAIKAGYYVANFEPTSAFWAPGDDGAAIDAWWQAFWDEIQNEGATDALNGNVGVTVVPNSWGLGAFRNSFGNLVGGANLILMETYGGPNTPSYPYPDLWPTPSASAVQALNTNGLPIACILSNLNLVSQASQANRIGLGNVHCWYCR